MKLFPAIDIRDGKCVRLYKGDFKQETIYAEEPVLMALKWQKKGAKYLHLVDLDGAVNGQLSNRQAITEILERVMIPVQIGGGIRSLEDIKSRLQIGIDRVIIGTMAVKQPDFVKQAIAAFGKRRIVVGIDAKFGMVATDGWEKLSRLSALEFAQTMEQIGVETIVYTDISRDGTMQGVNLEETAALINNTGLQVIASGGIHTIEDLRQVAEIGAYGTIIGKALYQETIDLEQAIPLFE